MLQDGRRRGWGGFYQAKPSLAVAPNEGSGEGEEQRSNLTMEQKKTCRELLEERQMRRYWRAQRRKRGKSCGRGGIEDNWRKREANGGKGWREEMTPRFANT